MEEEKQTTPIVGCATDVRLDYNAYAEGRILERMSTKQYERAVNYVVKISSKREIKVGHIVYHLKNGGEIITQPHNRRIELSDEVDPNVISYIQTLTKLPSISL